MSSVIIQSVVRGSAPLARDPTQVQIPSRRGQDMLDGVIEEPVLFN